MSALILAFLAGCVVGFVIGCQFSALGIRRLLEDGTLRRTDGG